MAGTAGAVQAWLWHRADEAGPTVTGDDQVWRRMATILNQPPN